MGKLAEPIFYSIQGEGPRAGYPSTFIRFSKCCLMCPFCDTKYAWEDNGGELDLDSMLSIVLNGPKDVVITGGEPLLTMNELAPKLLFDRLTAANYHITFETTMIFDKKNIKDGNVGGAISDLQNLLQFNPEISNQVLFMISPKLDTKCYGPEYSMADIYRYYSLSNQSSLSLKRSNINLKYKFIYSKDQEDILDELIIHRLPKWWVEENVYLMPKTPIPFTPESKGEYVRTCRDAVDYCIKRNVKYSPRIHIDLYGDVTGK